MKWLTSALSLMLSIAAVTAQNAGTPLATVSAAGYFSVFPQAPLVTIRFDSKSEDIAKVTAPQTSTIFNHDGKAFDGFVHSTSPEFYNDNVVDYAQLDKNRAEYKKNVKSGKWRRFVNGE
jgi:hypothetical protein